MNKQEILNEINKTKEHLANLEQMLKKCGCERWKPNSHDPYYYIDSTGSTNDTCFMPSSNDIKRFNNYNCFRTKKQAELEAEKILIRRQLEDIARRLNKGQKIDWSDETQYKWYIVYNTSFSFETYSVIENTTQGTVYCLDKNFLNTVIKEVGEGRLKAYLRGE